MVWAAPAVGMVSRRGGCERAASLTAQYDSFHAAGLEYGPAYRTITHAWACGDAASGQLRARLLNQGTDVHPADLDDALCVGALTGGSGTSNETRLPFAVDDALLRGVAGKLWAVR